MDRDVLQQQIYTLHQEAQAAQAHLVALIAQIKDYEYWYEQLQRQSVFKERRDDRTLP